MAQRADSFDLATLHLSSGEAAAVDLAVPLEPFDFGGERYATGPGEVHARVDVSRTTGAGYALRLRYGVELDGPCMRCLEAAAPEVEIDVREVDQPGDDEELSSPYIHDDAVDLRAWVRDAVALALPTQIICREGCAGLCPVCGENLNREPEHGHEPEPDPRWAELSKLRFD